MTSSGRTCAGPCDRELDELDYEVLLLGPSVFLDDHCLDCRRRQFGGRLLGEMEGYRKQVEVRAIRRRAREAVA